MSHTPGPWTLGHANSLVVFGVVNGGSQIVAEAAQMPCVEGPYSYYPPEFEAARAAVAKATGHE